MPRECLFCGATTDLSLEHVWPEWLLDFLPHIAPGFSLDSPSLRLSNVQSELQVRRYCQTTCNGGWMSEMESDTAPILKPLIRGKRRILSPRDQQLIAAWAYKTAIVMDSVRIEDSIFRREEYRRFFRHRRPPPTSSIVLASYADIQYGLWYRRTDLFIADPMNRLAPRPATPNAYVMTFTLFRVVFQLIGTVRERTFRVQYPVVLADALQPIWSATGESIIWPSSDTLGDGSLLEFHDSVGRGFSP